MNKVWRVYKRSFIMIAIIGVFSAPLFVSADHTTDHIIQQMQEQINTIMKRIQSISQELGIEQVLIPPVPVRPVEEKQVLTACPVFTYNLYLGLSDSETEGQVTPLQMFLAQDTTVYPEGLITGFFGPLTEQAVKRWQAKQGVVSSGSPDTTGYGVIGPQTREKMRASCDFLPTPTPMPPTSSNLPPVISGILGPTTLNVGQTGTWSVSARDPENGPLAYKVVWGDEALYPTPMLAPSASESVQQTATFTHVYSKSGVYTPVFYVTDTQGLSAKTSISVNVGAATAQGSLYLSPASLSVTVGQGAEIQAFYEPPMPPCPAGYYCAQMMPAPYPVTAKWVSSNPAVASVGYKDALSAVVTGISVGSTEVKAVYTESSGNTLSATAQVNVGGVTTRQPNYDARPTGSLIRGQSYDFVGKVTNALPNTKIYFFLRRPDGTLKYSDRTDQDILQKAPSHFTDANGNYSVSARQTLTIEGQNGTWVSWVTVGGMASNKLIHTVAGSAVPQQPPITVLSPNGGESWTVGSAQTIIWNSFNAPPGAWVALYLEPTGEFIVQGLPVSGKYSWTISDDSCQGDACVSPRPTGSNFKISAKLYTGDYLCIGFCPQIARNTVLLASDTSDAPFSIVSASASIKIIPGIQPQAQLAPRNAIVPFTSISIIPTEPVFLDEVVVERAGFASDSVFKEVVLIAKPSPGIDAKNIDRVIASASIDSSNHRAVLRPRFSSVFNQEIMLMVAGVMAYDLSIYAGQTPVFSVMDVKLHRQSDGKLANVSAKFPISGAVQTVNNSLEIGRLSLSGLASDNSFSALTFTAGKTEVIRIDKIVLQKSGGGIIIDGSGKSVICEADITSINEVCNFGTGGLLVPNGSSVTMRPLSGRAFLDYSLREREVVAYGQTYNYRLLPVVDTQPSITVLSPNGGESWQVGNGYEIRWTSQNISWPYITVALLKGGSVVGQPLFTHLTNDGVERWIIPSGLAPGSDYKINIYCTPISGVAGCEAKDDSDAPFSIVSSATMPYVTVLSPNGGESLIKGQTHEIRWEYNGFSSTAWAQIQLRDASNSSNIVKVIAQSTTMGGGLYNWPVPADIPDGKYLIWITGPAPSHTDFSDAAFSIVSSGALTVSLDASTPIGKTVLPGSTNVPLTILKLSASSEAINLRQIALQADGSNVNVLIFRIVSIWDGATKVGECVFAISNTCTSSFMSVTIPANSSKSLTIKGDFSPVGPTYPAVPGDTIAINYDGDRAKSTYGVGLTSGNTIYSGSISDTGAYKFTLGSSATPSITVLSPNGGESWQIGSLHTILWTPYDPNYDPNLGVNSAQNVSAYLENLNGVRVGKIIESGKASIHWVGELDNYGNYAQPGDYYVRVINNITGQQDRSDRAFTLLPMNTVKADLKINGSDGPISIGSGGETVTFSWTSSSADSCKLYLNGLAADLSGLAPSGSKSIFLKPNPYSGQLMMGLTCESAIGSASDNVGISPTPGISAVSVLSPNGGETLDFSSPYNITWQMSSDITKVSIALYKNDAFFNWIATSLVPGEKWVYSWTPSQSISSSNVGSNVFKIYMIGYKSSGGTVEDKSDAPFSIVASGALTVSLDASTPIGKTVLPGSTNVPLTILKFSASTETVNLQQIALQADGSGADVLFGRKVSIWDGAVKVGECVFPIGNTCTSFLVSTVSIPAGGSKSLTIKGDFSLVGPTYVAKPGDTIAINYDGDRAQSTYGVGLTSGNTIYSGSISDTGAYKFTLGSSETPSITVLSPNGGESWVKGTTKEIVWLSPNLNGSNVQIQLWNSTKTQYWVICSSCLTGNSGSDFWNIPASFSAGNVVFQESGNFTIRIVSLNNTSIADDSDSPFSIVTQTATGVDFTVENVSLPTSGDTGKEVVLAFDIMNRGNVTFNGSVHWTVDYLSAVNGYNSTERLISDGCRSATVAPGTGCRVNLGITFNDAGTKTTPIKADYDLLHSELNENNNTATKSITISTNVPVIDVVSPNGGESFVVSSQLSISLITQNLAGKAVMIDLWKGGAFYRSIASYYYIGQDGFTYSTTWPIPSDVPSGSDYKIHVSTYPDRYTGDMSDATFTITAPVSLSTCNALPRYSDGTLVGYGGCNPSEQTCTYLCELDYDGESTRYVNCTNQCQQTLLPPTLRDAQLASVLESIRTVLDQISVALKTLRWD